MSTSRTCVALLAISLGIIPLAHARIIPAISYAELFEKSNFIVIAKAVTKSADTTEKTKFGDMEMVEADGSRRLVPAIGVETSFEVVRVLKGDTRIKKFVLHHYREASDPSALTVDGPETVSFDPSDPKRRKDVLLFLVKEPDGRYAPYGGQTDPSARSIFALDDPQ